jgi:DNA-binding MarR family transcriptional regulator
MSTDNNNIYTDEHAYWMYGLFFFGYRSLIHEGDKYLLSQNLGRAHIRVILALRQRPGTTVKELCSFLSVSQQAISRTLKQLIIEECISQEERVSDRRNKHLYLTPKGLEACDGVMKAQKKHLIEAYKSVGLENADGGAKLLLGMMSEESRQKFEQLWGQETHYLSEEN